MSERPDETLKKWESVNKMREARAEMEKYLERLAKKAKSPAKKPKRPKK